MRAIDTNALIRLIVRDDTDQARLAMNFTIDGAWVSHLVLAEAIWVLSSVYAMGKAAISTAVEMLLDQYDLVIQEPEVVTSALADYRAHNGVEFTDCLILQIARKAGHLPLGTFDRALSKVDGAERIGRK
jgi:predicted nucleic-acid-binding protein